MTGAPLRRRLDRLAPPLMITGRTAPAIDPRTLEAMRCYLSGRPVTVPDMPDAVQQAMDEFLAGNGPLPQC